MISRLNKILCSLIEIFKLNKRLSRSFKPDIYFFDFHSLSFCFNFFLINIEKEMSLPLFHTHTTEFVPCKQSQRSRADLLTDLFG